MNQGQPLERRKLLRWLSAAALILLAVLAGCANSTPPRQYQRSRSSLVAATRR